MTATVSLRIAVLAVLLFAGSAAAVDSPVPMVRDVIREGLAAIAERRAAIREGPDVARELIERHLLPHTDSRRIARFVADGYWREGTRAQRDRFTRAFTDYLVHSYAAGISQYVGRIADFARHGRIRYRRLDDGDKRTVVRATLQPGDGPSINVDIHLHHVAERWQVYDVQAVGVSLLLAYRESLLPRFHAAGLEGVSAYLERRVDVRRPTASAPAER